MVILVFGCARHRGIVPGGGTCDSKNKDKSREQQITEVVITATMSAGDERDQRGAFEHFSEFRIIPNKRLTCLNITYYISFVWNN